MLALNLFVGIVVSKMSDAAEGEEGEGEDGGTTERMLMRSRMGMFSYLHEELDVVASPEDLARAGTDWTGEGDLEGGQAAPFSPRTPRSLTETELLQRIASFTEALRVRCVTADGAFPEEGDKAAMAVGCCLDAIQAQLTIIGAVLDIKAETKDIKT